MWGIDSAHFWRALHRRYNKQHETIMRYQKQCFMRCFPTGIVLLTLAICRTACCGEIHKAAAQGNLSKATMLLKENPRLSSSTDKDGWTPLHHAVAESHKAMVALLLDHKADVNAKSYYHTAPLHLATLLSWKDVVTSRAIVALLLDNGAQPNVKDASDESPLFQAVYNGDATIVAGLLKHKANSNARD